MVVRKIGMPGQPELAIGAIASGNIIVHEPRIADEFPDLGRAFGRIAEHERRELERREQAYRPGLPPLDLTGKTVILVDDGLATGSTMLAAAQASRKAGAASIVIAAPVASTEAVSLVKAEADDVVILETPAMLFSIGQWYENFDQVEDAEVCRLLDRNRKTAPAPDAQHREAG
jgi:putative phosphoribosyl transferase